MFKKCTLYLVIITLLELFREGGGVKTGQTPHLLYTILDRRRLAIYEDGFRVVGVGGLPLPAIALQEGQYFDNSLSLLLLAAIVQKWGPCWIEASYSGRSTTVAHRTWCSTPAARQTRRSASTVRQIGVQFPLIARPAFKVVSHRSRCGNNT